MQQETLPLTPLAGWLGALLRLLAPLAIPAARLPHLEIPRVQLAALLSHVVGSPKQQQVARAFLRTRPFVSPPTEKPRRGDGHSGPLRLPLT
jgi:hypothetical protein